MEDSAEQTTVAERLRALQSQNGMTIAEMAETCGLPKRSLENYMNVRVPQRPGVDALIAIAKGLDVSIDWLVGLTDTPEFSHHQRRYAALGAFSSSVAFLRKLALSDPSTGPIVPGDGTILGRSPDQVAAEIMIDTLNYYDRCMSDLTLRDPVARDHQKIVMSVLDDFAAEAVKRK